MPFGEDPGAQHVAAAKARPDGREGISMTQQMWVRSHVERLLQGEWDVCRVTADADGDYPWRAGPAACCVRVLDGPQPYVRVFAHTVLDVKKSAKLLDELNQIQQRALSAAVRWDHGTVLVSQTLVPIGMDRTVLGQAMYAVSELARELGPMIAAVYGGTTPFPVESEGSAPAGGDFCGGST